jgi:hypothetical protein
MAQALHFRGPEGGERPLEEEQPYKEANMGQQQLLLIVLGVIVVGIAVVIGISMFNQGAMSANIDAVVNDVVNMGARAQQYYVKPAAMGGGDRTFTGIELADIGKASNENATSFEISTTEAQEIEITAHCAVAKKDDGSDVTVVATVDPAAITTAIDN